MPCCASEPTSKPVQPQEIPILRQPAGFQEARGSRRPKHSLNVPFIQESTLQSNGTVRSQCEEES